MEKLPKWASSQKDVDRALGVLLARFPDLSFSFNESGGLVCHVPQGQEIVDKYDWARFNEVVSEEFEKEIRL